MTHRPPFAGAARGRAGRPSFSKYRAVRTTVDGITFASKKEAKRYMELKLMEKAGEIRLLVLQPPMPFSVFRQDGKLEVCFEYVADFCYVTKAGVAVWEDVKGFKTPVYRLKKKLIEAQYGIEIKEV